MADAVVVEGGGPPEGTSSNLVSTVTLGLEEELQYDRSSRVTALPAHIFQDMILGSLLINYGITATYDASSIIAIEKEVPHSCLQ